MLFSKSGTVPSPSVPISEFQYRQLVSSNAPLSPFIAKASEEEDPMLAQTMLHEAVAAERVAAIAETETRIGREYEEMAKLERARISQALEKFKDNQKSYFARVEAEVVQLALSIAAKILHREVQVDPMLTAALVQIALTQMKDGSAAVMRVHPAEGKRWTDHFANQPSPLTLSVIEDAELQKGDCILETELGSANFNIDVQLKEVERGFFDILAQRPPT